MPATGNSKSLRGVAKLYLADNFSRLPIYSTPRYPYYHFEDQSYFPQIV